MKGTYERGRVMLVGELAVAWASDLAERGFEATTWASTTEALDALPEEDPEVVVAQLATDDVNGQEVCLGVAERRPGVPVVVVATGDLEQAVQAMRAGAHDFLRPPVVPDVLAMALDKAVAHCRLRREVRLLRRRARLAGTRGSMMGESAAMSRTFRLMERVADTSSSVLITGESGTGKELVARELHARSRRRDGPFVAINCAAVPETLLESELFGHVRGAFTDARSTRPGLFVKAEGGTLLLDEIGDMPLGLQPRLLRAIQDKAVRPVGADQEVPVDVRLMAATHRNLEELVDQGTFRGDLLYRLDVIRIEVPPLRDRGNDILVLAQQFLERYARTLEREITGFEPEAARRLLAYRWPGNVRELQNCVERAAVLAEHDQIVVDDLPERVRRSQRGSVSVPVDVGTSAMPTLAEVENRYIEQVLASVGGNKASAARILGIDRKTLHRKLRGMGVGQIAPGGSG